MLALTQDGAAVSPGATMPPASSVWGTCTAVAAPAPLPLANARFDAIAAGATHTAGGDHRRATCWPGAAITMASSAPGSRLRDRTRAGPRCPNACRPSPPACTSRSRSAISGQRLRVGLERARPTRARRHRQIAVRRRAFPASPACAAIAAGETHAVALTAEAPARLGQQCRRPARHRGPAAAASDAASCRGRDEANDAHERNARYSRARFPAARLDRRLRGSSLPPAALRLRRRRRSVRADTRRDLRRAAGARVGRTAGST